MKQKFMKALAICAIAISLAVDIGSILIAVEMFRIDRFELGIAIMVFLMINLSAQADGFMEDRRKWKE